MSFVTMLLCRYVASVTRLTEKRKFRNRLRISLWGKTVAFEVCGKIGCADKPEGLEPVKT